MDLNLKNKVVLVTGASRGIGRAVAEAYVSEGAIVYISSRTASKLEKTVEEINSQLPGAHIHYLVCDLSEAREIDTMLDHIIEKHGHIDVVINSTGGPVSGRFEDIKETDWHDAFETNLLSIVRVLKTVIPVMKRNQAGGRIVSVTSSSMKQSIDNLVLSNTLRPGILGLTKTVAREHADDNILINAVGPGKIATDRLKSLVEANANRLQIPYEEAFSNEVAGIPMQRLGEPEEIAKMILFLGSFANTYVSGQQILVDGAAGNAL